MWLIDSMAHLVLLMLDTDEDMAQWLLYCD